MTFKNICPTKEPTPNIILILIFMTKLGNMYHISSKIIFQMTDIQVFDLTSVTCDKVEVYQQENEQ